MYAYICIYVYIYIYIYMYMYIYIYTYVCVRILNKFRVPHYFVKILALSFLLVGTREGILIYFDIREYLRSLTQSLTFESNP